MGKKRTRSQRNRDLGVEAEDYEPGPRHIKPRVLHLVKQMLAEQAKQRDDMGSIEVLSRAENLRE